MYLRRNTISSESLRVCVLFKDSAHRVMTRTQSTELHCGGLCGGPGAGCRECLSGGWWTTINLGTKYEDRHRGKSVRDFMAKEALTKALFFRNLRVAAHKAGMNAVEGDVAVNPYKDDPSDEEMARRHWEWEYEFKDALASQCSGLYCGSGGHIVTWSDIASGEES